MPRKPKGYERMREPISYRVTYRQREFLERIMDERKIGLCEAARIVLDDAMKRAGAEM